MRQRKEIKNKETDATAVMVQSLKAKLYQARKIHKFYARENFKKSQKTFYMYKERGDGSNIFSRYSEDEERDLTLIIMKTVTKTIFLDKIALASSVLTQYFENSKDIFIS